MKARQIYMKALMLLDRGALERGENALRMTINTAERENDRITRVQALVCLGDLLCDTSRGEAARTFIECALDVMCNDDTFACERERARQLLERTPSLDFKNKTYLIADFIVLVRAKADRVSGYAPDWLYDVYGEDAGDGDNFHVAQTVYVGDTLVVDDDDRVVYPKQVVALRYEFLYSGQHFQDVVDLAYGQKPNATIEDIVRCLNHFYHYDDFLDLND